VKNNAILIVTLTLLSILIPQLSTAFAQGTAFTYQGRLNVSGAPANGAYDLLFTVYDLPSGPGAFANQTNSALAISNGLFTVTLDFGPGIFTGPERWLEIAVRTNGSGSYANLVPRQRLTPTPYAITAGNFSGSISAGQLSGTIPLTQLPSAVVTNNQSGVNFTGTFAGNGAGVTNVSVSSLRQTVPPVVAWGDNFSGQINVPAGLSNVMAIAGGGDHSLALKSDGTVVAWGDSGFGQTNVPAGLNNVTAIAGGYNHSLALKSDGTVVAWGYNGEGQTNVPAGLNNVMAIAGGGNHSLALKSDETVVAWGFDGGGQTTVPAGLSNVMAIAGGGAHNLALKSDGTVVAWGGNFSGQTDVPAGLNNVMAIAGGFAHSLALKSDGTVVAWGDNGSGEITVPAGLGNVVAIAGGFAHSLALRLERVPAPIALLNQDNVFQGTVTASGFAGNGAGLTGLNAANVTGTLGTAQIPNLDASKIGSGTLADARLSANVALRAGGNAFTGNQTVTSGNVGIGTGTLTGRLTVQTTDDLNPSIVSAYDSRHVVVGTPSAGLALSYSPLNGSAYITALAPNVAFKDLAIQASTLSFRPSGAAAALTVLNNGNVGIGTPVPASKLEVQGAVAAIRLNPDLVAIGSNADGYEISLVGGVPDGSNMGGQIRLGGSSRGDAEINAIQFKQNDSEVMRIHNGGNVGIGTSDPSQKLHVIGNILASGTITPNSDRNAKTEFEPVDTAAILKRVAALPIQQWRFKAEEAGVRHVGPMAQDFHSAFGLGAVPTAISTVDADGVALAAIQGLNQKLEQKETEITELKARLTSLEKLVDLLSTKGN